MRKSRIAIGSAIGLAGALAIAIVFGGVVRDSRDPGGTPPAPSASPRAAPASEAGARELSIASGQTLALDAASLEPGRPVALRLQLAVPSRSADPRPVRVLAPDGRVLEGLGVLGDDRMDARLEIDSAWLAPGRYVIEVKTTELSHFPLRRYALEIR